MASETTPNDPITEVINLLAAPLASGIRTIDQMRRGVDELFRTIDNLNTTLENLNESAMRVNRLMAEIEEPIRAMVPQLTRTIRAADEITTRLEGPVRAAAPNLERVAATLSSPAFAALPQQLNDFVNTFNDVSRRLNPLSQLAENAGGLLGMLPGMSGAGRPAGGGRSQTSAERPAGSGVAAEPRPDVTRAKQSVASTAPAEQRDRADGGTKATASGASRKGTAKATSSKKASKPKTAGKAKKAAGTKSGAAKRSGAKKSASSPKRATSSGTAGGDRSAAEPTADS